MQYTIQQQYKPNSHELFSLEQQSAINTEVQQLTFAKQ